MLFKKPIFISVIIFIISLSGCINQDQTDIDLEQDQSKVSFATPPDTIEWTVGVPFKYSFCNPEPNEGEGCGPFFEVMNPVGGKPPYAFTTGFGAGLRPPGMILNLNGVFEGTPTLEGLYTFEVCAEDIDGNQDCHPVSMNIKEAVKLTVHFGGGGAGSFQVSPGGLSDFESGCGDAGACETTYERGTQVTISAEPSDGSTFAGWSGACGGKGECVLTMDDDAEVTANFQPDCKKFPGTVYNPSTEQCECSSDSFWTGTQCQNYQDYCNKNYPGSTYNPSTNNCESPTATSAPTTTPPPSTPAPEPTTQVGTVAIGSAQCTYVSQSALRGYNQVEMTASGTATGPVGMSFNVYTIIEKTMNCGSWTYKAGTSGSGSSCKRGSGQPETTSWNWASQVTTREAGQRETLTMEYYNEKDPAYYRQFEKSYTCP